MKIDPETGGKRKLSKRKDPELALTFYAQEGYPVPALGSCGSGGVRGHGCAV